MDVVQSVIIIANNMNFSNAVILVQSCKQFLNIVSGHEECYVVCIERVTILTA